MNLQKKKKIENNLLANIKGELSLHHQNVSYVAILEGAAPSASRTYSLSPGQFEKHSPDPIRPSPQYGQCQKTLF